jgi:hypothetical protein
MPEHPGHHMKLRVYPGESHELPAGEFPFHRHLLQAGYFLTVFNRSRAAVEILAQAGARPAGLPREVAEQSDI